MKVYRFFELAVEAVDEFLRLMNNPKETHSGAKVQVIYIESPEKFKCLSSVFSNPPKTGQLKTYNYNIGNYLHSLLVESVAVSNQNKEVQDNISPNFLILGTDPLTLIHAPGSDLSFLATKLQLLKTELLNRKEKFLSDWKTETVGGKECVFNVGTAEDWRVIFNCIDEYVGTSKEEKEQFLKKLESDDSKPFECRLSPEEFYKLNTYHGIKAPCEVAFIKAMKEFLVSIEQEELKKLSEVFLGLMKNNSPLELYSLAVKSAEKNLNTTSEVMLNFCLKMQNICLNFQVSMSLVLKIQKLAEVSPKGQEIDDSENTDSPNSPVLKGLSEEDIQILRRIESQCIQKAKITKTLAPLADPYDPIKETIVIDTLIDINSLIQLLNELGKSIINMPEYSDQVSSLIEWLKQSFDRIFLNLLKSLYSFHYYGPIIEIAKAVIDCLEKLRKKTNKNESVLISENIHRLKECYTNSLLFSVQFDMFRSRLEYFGNVHADFCSKDNWSYFFEQANNFNLYALMYQIQLDFKNTRDCLDKASRCLESGLIAFKTKGDVSQAKKLMDKSQVLSAAISSSYHGLGTQEFESADFYNAFITLQHANKRDTIDFRKKVLTVINSVAINQSYSLPKSTESKKTLKNTYKISERWCEIEQLSSIKGYLEKNHPNHLSLSIEGLSLELSSSVKGFLTELGAKFTQAKIAHTKSKNRIIFKNFAQLDLGQFKAVFAEVPSCDGSSGQAIPMPDQSSDEYLRFQRLLGMHNKSLLSPSADLYFDSLCEELWIFCTQCQDPLLKLKALKTLICHRLARLLVSWDSNKDLDDTETFNAIEKQVEEARNCAQSLNHPEANRILEPVEILFQNHKMLRQEYTRSCLISNVKKVVNKLCGEDSKDSLYCLALRLGHPELLSFYNELSLARTNFLRKALCYNDAAYKQRETLLEPVGVLCFKMAYELWSSASLVGVEGNSKDAALARLQDEYNQIDSLVKSHNFKFSIEVTAMRLVASTTLEENTNVKSLQNFDAAFSKAKNFTNTVFSTFILLKKIDHIMSLSSDHYFPAIIDTLKTFLDHFAIIKVQRKFRNENNLNYIVFETTKLICRYAKLSQRPIHHFPSDSMRECLDLQLAVLNQFKGVLKSKKDDSKEAQEWVKEANECVNEAEHALINGKIILNALRLEVEESKTKIADTSAESKRVLLPDLLSELSLLPTDPKQFDLTNNHFIKSVLLCEEISDRAVAKVLGDHQLPQSLCDSYRDTAKIVVDYLCQTILPKSVIECFRSENDDALSVRKLATLIKSHQAAHLLQKVENSEEVISLLRAILKLYPKNARLLFTLFHVLSDNNVESDHCSELRESCKKAADLGHPQAQYHYARLLQKGRFQTPEDHEAAKVYLEKSQQQGYYKAQYRMAVLHKQGLFGFKQDDDSVNQYAEEAISNPETSDSLRKKIEDSVYVYFYLPPQDY